MRWLQLAVLVLLISLSATLSWASSPEATIRQLTQTIDCSSSPGEQARYLVYRARHYLKLKQPEYAERDYLAALEAREQGWVWAELASLYARQKRYKKAERVLGHIQKNYPHLKSEVAHLTEVVQDELQKHYLAENPPEIILDAAPNRNYVSRVQLKNRALARIAATAPVAIPKPQGDARRAKKTYQS